MSAGLRIKRKGDNPQMQQFASFPLGLPEGVDEVGCDLSSLQEGPHNFVIVNFIVLDIDSYKILNHGN